MIKRNPLNTNQLYIYAILELLQIPDYSESQCLLMNGNTWDAIYSIATIPSSNHGSGMLSVFGLPVMLNTYLPDDIIGIVEYQAGLNLTLSRNSTQKYGAKFYDEIKRADNGWLFLHDDIQYISIKIDGDDDNNNESPYASSFAQFKSSIDKLPPTVDGQPIPSLKKYEVSNLLFELPELINSKIKDSDGDTYVFVMSHETAKGLILSEETVGQIIKPEFHTIANVPYIYSDIIPDGILAVMLSVTVPSFVELMKGADLAISLYHKKVMANEPISGMFLSGGQTFYKLPKFIEKSE